MSSAIKSCHDIPFFFYPPSHLCHCVALPTAQHPRVNKGEPAHDDDVNAIYRKRNAAAGNLSAGYLHHLARTATTSNECHLLGSCINTQPAFPYSVGKHHPPTVAFAQGIDRGQTGYLLTKENSPFSFFQWIFLYPQADTESEIITHEKTHVRQWHSFPED